MASKSFGVYFDRKDIFEIEPLESLRAMVTVLIEVGDRGSASSFWRGFFWWMVIELDRDGGCELEELNAMCFRGD